MGLMALSVFFSFYFFTAPSIQAERNSLQHYIQQQQKDFETFLLIENGKVYQQSDAALRVAKRFSWYWQWTQVLWLLPRPVRNGAYSFIARRRYRWFGKKEACMIPTPDIQQRFLPE